MQVALAGESWDARNEYSLAGSTKGCTALTWKVGLCDMQTREPPTSLRRPREYIHNIQGSIHTHVLICVCIPVDTQPVHAQICLGMYACRHDGWMRGWTDVCASTDACIGTLTVFVYQETPCTSVHVCKRLVPGQMQNNDEVVLPTTTTIENDNDICVGLLWSLLSVQLGRAKVTRPKL